MDLVSATSPINPSSLVPQAIGEADNQGARWVESLAKIVSVAGYERLVACVLVVADEAHFPDKWRGGPASASRLALRLVHYAGLEGLEVDLKIVDSEGEEAVKHPEIRPQEALAAWLLAIRDGKIEMALDRRALQDPALVLAALARVVAHAFAQLYGLVKDQTQVQSEWIDLCAIFLGFGVVTANAARRYVTGAGGGVRRVQSLGRLSWREQSFLLALVARVRRLSKNDLRVIEKLLEREQAQAFRESCESLSEQNGDLLVRKLNLPHPRTWPAALDLADVLVKLPAPVESADALDRGIVGKNRGRPVFRVQRRMSFRLFQIGLGATFAAGVFLRLDQSASYDPSAVAVISMLAVACLSVIGFFIEENRCSEAKCEARLKPAMQECPRCSGNIVGVIKHPRDRLAAEEAWRNEQAKAQRERNVERGDSPDPND
jgi:hypothetical protein